jgi:hypothetical protein
LCESAGDSVCLNEAAVKRDVQKADIPGFAGEEAAELRSFTP